MVILLCGHVKVQLQLYETGAWDRKTFLSDREAYCDSLTDYTVITQQFVEPFFLNGGQPSWALDSGQDPAVPHTLRYPISKEGLGPCDGLWQIGVEPLDSMHVEGIV